MHTLVLAQEMLMCAHRRTQPITKFYVDAASALHTVQHSVMITTLWRHAVRRPILDAIHKLLWRTQVEVALGAVRSPKNVHMKGGSPSKDCPSALRYSSSR